MGGMNTIAAFFHSRFFQFLILPAIVLGWLWLTDPSHGADTLLRLQLWAQALLTTGLAYAVAKALLGKASSEDLYQKASDGNRAAGVAYLGVCLLRALVLLGLLLFFGLLQR